MHYCVFSFTTLNKEIPVFPVWFSSFFRTWISVSFSTKFLGGQLFFLWFLVSNNKNCIEMSKTHIFMLCTGHGTSSIKYFLPLYVAIFLIFQCYMILSHQAKKLLECSLNMTKEPLLLFKITSWSRIKADIWFIALKRFNKMNFYHWWVQTVSGSPKFGWNLTENEHSWRLQIDFASSLARNEYKTSLKILCM